MVEEDAREKGELLIFQGESAAIFEVKELIGLTIIK